MLAVRFHDFPHDATFGSACRVKVELLYFGKLDYTELSEGNTFSVHEGPKIVATGKVLKGHDAEQGKAPYSSP